MSDEVTNTILLPHVQRFQCFLSARQAHVVHTDREKVRFQVHFHYPNGPPYHLWYRIDRKTGKIRAETLVIGSVFDECYNDFVDATGRERNDVQEKLLKKPKKKRVKG